MTKGLIYDIRKYEIYDGPGFRTSVFFKGCNLNCFWCNTSYGINNKREIVFDKERCVSCFACADACVQRVTSDREGNVFECSLCGKCVDSCKYGARSIIGRYYESDKLVDFIFDEMAYYKNTNGGVTLTGGEPFLQHEFLSELLPKLKKLNINVAVKTCGNFDFNNIKSLLKYIDHVIFDISIFDDDVYKQYLQRDIGLIRSNLEELFALKKNVIIRFTLIEGISDTQKNAESLFRFLNGKENYKMMLAPYDMKNEKFYSNIGLDFKKDILNPSDAKRVETMKNIFGNICNDIEIVKL